MRVLVQIGYCKSGGRREGQIMRVYVNDEEVRIDKEAGRYLTSRVDSNRGKLWFLRELDLSDGDRIAVEVKTFVPGSGADETRTFDSLYVVDETEEISEVTHGGVGHRGIPLLKGRIKEVASVSKADERKQDIDNFLNEEGF